MDTREKIIPQAQVAGVLVEGQWIVVIGLFDPMTAVEAQRLAELGKARNLLVVVLDEDGTLLEASARAVLVAALRGVSAVTIGRRENWRMAMPENAAVQIVDDAEDEAARRNAFIELVIGRQQAR